MRPTPDRRIALGNQHGSSLARVIKRRIDFGNGEWLDGRFDPMPGDEGEHLFGLANGTGLAADHGLFASESRPPSKLQFYFRVSFS